MNTIPLINLFDFPGGVHPPENKVQSTSTAIATPPLPDIFVLPLNQHSGNPARVIVSTGDTVLKGQVLAKADGYVSAPIHAPTSGTIIGEVMHPVPHYSGLDEPCLLLEADGRDEWCPLHPLKNYQDFPNDVLVQRIYDAGVVGLGGAGFPAAVKMASRNNGRIHTLIVNGAECEPYITADDMLMREQASALVSGIQILQHLLQPERVLIGIEDNKPEALRITANACAGVDGVDVYSVPTKYPSGDAQRLIWLLTGKEVPNDGRSVDIGILCFNVGTIVAIHDAILEGKPLISRITTLTGAALERPGNVRALIGTPVEHLLTYAGVHQHNLTTLIQGGPMMGYTLTSAAVPITKTSNCIIAGTADEFPPAPPAQACIRCGLCADVCPLSLLPQQLHLYARAQNYSQLQHHNLFDCIECGACAYVCPSAIPLVQYYRAAKDEIRSQRQRTAKADRSRLRFEQRQTRMAQAEAEKEARRKANAEKARLLREAQNNAPPTANEAINHADDPIKAAMARVQARKAEKSNQQPTPTDLGGAATGASEPAASPAPKESLSSEQKSLKMRLNVIAAQLKKAEQALKKATEHETRQQLEQNIDLLKTQLDELEHGQ